MLNFIVLGYIPGTHVELTFTLLAGACSFGLISTLALSFVRRAQLKKRTLQHYMELLAL